MIEIKGKRLGDRDLRYSVSAEGIGFKASDRDTASVICITHVGCMWDRTCGIGITHVG